MGITWKTSSHFSEPRRRRRTLLAPTLALGVALAALAIPAGSAEPAAGHHQHERGPVHTLSVARPFRLVQSTGNLYWTHNTDPGPTGIGQSRIYKISKQGAPGTERAILQESNGGVTYFAALTYAKLGSLYYAFFVVNNPGTHTSVIKRVWLGGGTSRRIVTSPGYVWARDLVTDGTYLFWADEQGLNRSRMDGTQRTVLWQGPGLGQVALAGDRVFWADDNDIRSALKNGADLSLELRARSRVTDLSAQLVADSGYFILRGEQNGSVRGSFRKGVGEVGYQSDSTGRRVTSVLTSGPRIFWTDCDVATNDCHARVRSGSTQVSVLADSFPRDIQGDSGGAYWSDSTGLRRFTR